MCGKMSGSVLTQIHVEFIFSMVVQLIILELHMFSTQIQKFIGWGSLLEDSLLD